MNFILYLSGIIIPLTVFCIVGYALLNKHDVYSDFVQGAADGVRTVAGILPTMIGLMLGVGVLSSSGFLSFFTDLIANATKHLGLPAPVVPPMIVKMFSSSAATGLVLDLFKEYGTDSYEGLAASIMMCCTEAVFYTMSVYFLAAGVTKTRWTLFCSLLSTSAGIMASILLAGLLV